MEWDKWVMTFQRVISYATTSTFTRSTSSIAGDTRRPAVRLARRDQLYICSEITASPAVLAAAANRSNQYRVPMSTGKPFDPSRGKQYEAGVKYVPKDMPVVVTAAVYQLTKDKNLTADPNDPTGLFSRCKPAKSAPAALSWRRKQAVNANINLTAAYSYTDAGMRSRHRLRRRAFPGGSAA